MRHKYVCVRCGYETEFKSSMHNHFYKRQKPCPALAKDIELTQEIKQHILDNFIYLERKNDTSLTLPKAVKKCSVFHKINLLTASNFNDIQVTLDFSKVTPLDIVNKTCCKWDGSCLNMMYDHKEKVIYTYEDGWNIRSINDILQTLQTRFLNDYELYLIRESKDTWSLQEFYSFINAFQLDAYVKTLTDGDILNTTSSSYDLCDRYARLYLKASEKNNQQKINKIRNEVLNIIKINGKQCLEEIDKAIVQLAQTDPKVQQKLFLINML